MRAFFETGLTTGWELVTPTHCFFPAFCIIELLSCRLSTCPDVMPYRHVVALRENFGAVGVAAKEIALSDGLHVLES